MSTTQLRIRDIVGSSIWVASDDGQKVYNEIERALNDGNAVELSFSGRETMITAFLNAAIGQLYSGKLSRKQIEDNLSFTDLSGDDRDMLSRAIDNAKRYFENQRNYDSAWEAQVHDEE